MTQDIFDFTRCQRPDGTFYGTGGVCRSGVQVGAREMKALKQAAANGNKRAEVAVKVVEGKMNKQQANAALREGAVKTPKKNQAAAKPVKEPKSKAKAPTPKTENKAAPKDQAKAQKVKEPEARKAKAKEAAAEMAAKTREAGYSPKDKKAKEDMGVRERISDKITRMRNEGKVEKEIGFKSEADIKRATYAQMARAKAAGDKKEIERIEKLNATRRAQMASNREFAKKLEKEVPAGTKVTVNDWGEVVMSSKVGRHKVDATFSPTRGFNYQIDGKYDTGSITSRRQQMQTALKVRNMWDATVRSLPTGQTIFTAAYDGDGDKATNARIKAYKRLGFSAPNMRLEGRMFATKTADGRMVNGNDEGFLAMKLDPDSVYFRESRQRQATQGDELAAWYGILFPWES